MTETARQLEVEGRSLGSCPAGGLGPGRAQTRDPGQVATHTCVSLGLCVCVESDSPRRPVRPSKCVVCEQPSSLPAYSKCSINAGSPSFPDSPQPPSPSAFTSLHCSLPRPGRGHPPSPGLMLWRMELLPLLGPRAHQPQRRSCVGGPGATSRQPAPLFSRPQGSRGWPSWCPLPASPPE